MAMLGNLSSLFGGMFGRTPTAPMPAPRPMVAIPGHIISGGPAMPGPAGGRPLSGIFGRTPIMNEPTGMPTGVPFKPIGGAGTVGITGKPQTLGSMLRRY